MENIGSRWFNLLFKRIPWFITSRDIFINNGTWRRYDNINEKHKNENFFFKSSLERKHAFLDYRDGCT